MSTQQSPAIVFVYLNAEPPPYLIQNCRRLNAIFPNMDIIYVTDMQVIFPKDVRVRLVTVDTLGYENVFKEHELSKSFRNGFWQTSLLRILVLAEVHKMMPDSPIFHLEADVLLMPDFPFEKVLTINKLMWMKFNENLDVGAIVYSPTEIYSRKLANFILEKIQNDGSLTDMKALSLFRKHFRSDIELFPSQSSDSTFPYFDCLFDGAIYGMWLLGQDQRNHFGALVRYKDLRESFYKVGGGKFSFSQRGLSFREERNGEISIVNLHVHCKDTRIFSADNKMLGRRVEQSRRRINLPIFSISVFARLLINAILGGELKSFMIHLPVIGRILRGTRSALRRFNSFS